ncbi:hypothetical protein ONE63_000198 [Megalurothrips usitatus]|uniref:Uncharacterized protein n=1 Tax=Megalurothrips usitatus TaxID=439358 RepID=A0AAV7Y1J0_9NEOP|nr:hypothetical protein ONE63_000198 [Megalurothrips usitatus]
MLVRAAADNARLCVRHRVLAVLLVVVVGAVLVAPSSASPRHKRYLHFPFGSTLRFAFSSKWSTIFDRKKSPAFWTQGFNWGIGYDLPNGTQLAAPAGFGRFVEARRDRRDLYRRLETAIDSTGLLGRACLLRAICEAPQALPPENNLIAEFLRIILWYRLRSPPDGQDAPSCHYDSAQSSGARGLDCGDLYRDCPVSVLSLLLSLRPSPS